MCGFVVFVRAKAGALVDEATFAGMRDALAHRGPDDRSLATIDGWVMLGHRRLSIIDLEGARQPLHNEDGQIVCVFNGEIYNFLELRARLRGLGHQFATDGDGEIIVHGYEQWGDDVFRQLEGMFTVALVDRRRRRVVLARDRFGIKPLFYRQDAAGLTAASELKALLHGRSAPSASRTALALGAMRMHVPWPLTAFTGIFRVPPGALVEIEDGGEPRLRRIAPMIERGSEQRTTTAEASAFLEAAVARQMVADVPVGAFLSGGIDSTLIVALMRKISQGEIHTFSVQTVDYDESDVAAQTARELGTTHHTLPLSAITFDDLADLPRLYDEPFAETSALGVRALSRFARQHVKVALSGDGGDEVFGGYDSYRWIQRADALPIPGRRAAGRVLHQLLQRRWPPLVRRALRAGLVAAAPAATAQRDVTTLSWAASPGERQLSESLSELVERACGGDLGALDATRRGMLADRLERLPNAMLCKVDIASMSASLEVRVPMLDDALVRYADRIPIDQLVGPRHGKLLLRKVLETMPGGRVAWAAKRGFTLPLERWMVMPLIRPRLDQLFGDHASTLRTLTGVDVGSLWRGFLDDASRFSSATAAMQLLWFANVALWADQLGVRTVDDDPLDPVRIV
ncbi:MAG: asparagine synthase (glutamine-hydrolyzing) [Myxococcota bacterium]|nr:asparagine synthase (glutamine-hydrolyzing) [Myxococcota bacterium]